MTTREQIAAAMQIVRESKAGIRASASGEVASARKLLVVSGFDPDQTTSAAVHSDIAEGFGTAPQPAGPFWDPDRRCNRVFPVITKVQARALLRLKEGAPPEPPRTSFATAMNLAESATTRILGIRRGGWTE